MTEKRAGRTRERRGEADRSGGWVVAVAMAVMLLASLGTFAAEAAGLSPRPSAAPGAENITVQATATLAFVPNELTVYPNSIVHLVVIQAANFPHTFVLSSVANQQISPSISPTGLYQYFNLHPPLVNLSLPGTPGAKAYANFTAPGVGTYEFVCEIPTHFQAGMYGELVSTTNSTSTSSGFPTTLAIEVGGLVAVIAAVIGGFAWSRRRRPGSPPPTTP